MSTPEKLRKHALECLRLAADCTQSARVVHDPVLRAHFAGMAKRWSALAEHELSADPGTMKPN
jgi:hypothetical protein